MLPDCFLGRRAMTLGVCLLLLGGCRQREKKIRIQQTDEDSATLASVIHMSDAKAAPQLLKGFHSIEENAWRWTMGQFAVALRPPRNAAIRGAVLRLKFVVPEPVLAKLKKISLTAAVNGTSLPAETYTKSGEFEYTRDVDAKLLSGEAVNVEFTLDKFLPAGEIEQRELGVIVSSVGFEAK